MHYIASKTYFKINTKFFVFFFNSPSTLPNISVGINGFDRIGRLVLRCALEQNIHVVGING